MDKFTDKKYYSAQITERFFFAMDRIVGSRTTGKVTAVAFGTKVGISSSNLGRIRNNPGEQFVTVEAIGRLCKHYGISPAWLITGKGDPYGKENQATGDHGLEKRVVQLEKTVTILQKVKK